jgi:hypothetical protein
LKIEQCKKAKANLAPNGNFKEDVGNNDSENSFESWKADQRLIESVFGLF